MSKHRRDVRTIPIHGLSGRTAPDQGQRNEQDTTWARKVLSRVGRGALCSQPVLLEGLPHIFPSQELGFSPPQFCTKGPRGGQATLSPPSLLVATTTHPRPNPWMLSFTSGLQLPLPCRRRWCLHGSRTCRRTTDRTRNIHIVPYSPFGVCLPSRKSSAHPPSFCTSLHPRRM